MGDYRVDGSAITTHARLMDMERLRLSPELTETGPLTNLISIQTALAWDVLNTLNPGTVAKSDFVSQFPAERPEVLENYVRGITAANEQEKIKRFKEVVNLEPAHSLAMMQLGNSYYKARDYESAMSWLTRIPSSAMPMKRSFISALPPSTLGTWIKPTPPFALSPRGCRSLRS
jgi:hypothetical protein